MPKSISPSSNTLADFVRLTAEHRTRILKERGAILKGSDTYRLNTQHYKIVADQLIGVKKHSFDQTVIDLIESTRPLDTEDVIAQLSHVTFPFDKMWIEGPVFAQNLRLGAFIEADQETGSFTIKYFKEGHDRPDNLYNLNDGRELQCFLDGKVLDTRPVTLKVSPDGVDLDEDALVALVTRVGEDYKNKGISNDATNLITEAYNVADYFARLFVVLSSENIPNNFNTPKSEEEVLFEEKNRRRVKMGFAPILSVTSLKIDLSYVDLSQLQSKDAKRIRALLGWTSVRRSKPIVSKYGVVFRRRPHDRRIASPVDRRDAMREIFDSRPDVGIEISENRPFIFRNGTVPQGEPSQ